MKTILRLLSAVVASFAALTASAQFGAGAGAQPGSTINPAMAKLFGENSSFTSTVEMQAKEKSSGDEMSMPGKISFSEGRSRFEMDMTKIKSAQMPAAAIAQMKAMGMDSMVMISRPDKKASYVIYPGLKAYAEIALKPADAAAAASFKAETTELGKEAVDGHECVKNKVVVTGEKGDKHEFTVWNAADLKKFPVKVAMVEEGTAVTMTFKEVKFAKPDDSAFSAPEGFKKYDDMMTLVQTEMMKKMGGGGQ